MNQLEVFLTDLNSIQSSSDDSKHDKLVEYLFNKNGWIVLRSIYFKKIQVNEMLAEKVADSLIQLSSQLLQVNEQLVKSDNTDDTTNTIEDLIKLDQGSLYTFIMLSLDLFTRYNDGSMNNSILVSVNQSKCQLLNDLCQHVFKQNTNFKLKSNYLKFLQKLFQINFKNYHLKLKQNGTQSQLTNTLFQAQFNHIHTSGHNDQLLKLVIDYLSQCSSLLNTKQNNQFNINLFTNLCQTLNESFQFICDNLTDSQSDHLSTILIEMNQFKIFYEHTQQCLRSKHTHISCKTDLNKIFTSKHNTITNNPQNDCIFAQLVLYLLSTTELKLTISKKIQLLNKIGLCSCIKLDELLNCLNDSIIDDLDTVICEYLNLINLNEDDFKESLFQQQQTRRQSAFYSLLADENLIKEKSNQIKHQREFNLKDNKFFKLILKFDSRSVLLCKCLSNNLKKYSKFLPTTTYSPKEDHLDDSLDTDTNQYESFKFITFEIFYLYVKVLKYFLKNVLKSDDDDLTLSDDDLTQTEEMANNKIQHINQLIEIICKYLNDFLLINNSYMINKTNIINAKSNDSKLKSYKTFHSLNDSFEDGKLTNGFIEFLNKNSIKLNKITMLICTKLNLPLNMSISLCAHLIQFQEMNQNKTSIKSTGSQIEQALCKSILDELNHNVGLLNNHYILDVLLELYLKSSVFRFALNELTTFHVNLITCLNDYIEKQNDENHLYLELLLDLIFVYFYFNRKKDLNDIYPLMKKQLCKNSNLLLVYFNVMILSKAFKLNKVLLLFNKNEVSTTDTNNNMKQNESVCSKFDYDADNEANQNDTLNEASTLEIIVSSPKPLNDQKSSNHLNYRYDLILFPRILDLCLTFIHESLHQPDIKPVIELFFKRLLYLLETCHFNIQILISNHFKPYFTNMLPTSCPIKDKQLIHYCFEILYYLNLNDLNENLLINLLKKTLVKSDDYYLNDSLFISNQCASLILKLTKNLQMFQCSQYLRLPNQTHQEPIDYLLQTSLAPKKFSKINLNYEQVSSQSPPQTNNEHLNRMKQESAHKISCIKIPYKTIQPTLTNTQSQSDLTNRHSYSLCFILRYDDNLINFSKSYGLCSNNSRVGSSKLALESYAHLISLNLDNQDSSFEIWLNPNGNLLFIRRSDQAILYPMNLMQIPSNLWHFIYVDYCEEQLTSLNKLNCTINYSLNAHKINTKEFEIHCSPQQMHSISHKQTLNTNLQFNNLFLFIGHQEVKAELNYLFHYDLGQVILTKDSSYSLEHLVILMQIMDTNISLLDKINEYEWNYLNGYCDSKILDNLNRNFTQYAEHIKSHIIVVYHPRNSHIAGMKSVNTKTLSYSEIATSCKSIQESSIDIALAKIGGTRQLLLLLAKLVEQENNLKSSESSLKILESFLNLINKRAHSQIEFKQMHGYSLLKHIYKSIAAQNKYQKTSNYYYKRIQKELFVLLMNACFRKSVLTLNYYMNNRIETCFETKSSNQFSQLSVKSSENNIYLININLLSYVIIDWDLWWQPYDPNEPPLWKNMLEILDTLLSDYNQYSLYYHTDLFIKYNILEKLMHFILDANEENYVFRKNSLEPFVRILKHFNSITTNNLDEIKKLFSNFFEYLHILHPENKAYIVYSTNYFYYNLTLSLPSVPFKSMQEYSKTPKESLQMDPETPNFMSLNEKRTIQDRFQFNESLNEKSFSQVSATLMEVMHDMITILPDNMLSEIFNLLKYESFIMFTMDENQSKRFEAFKLFLTLIERSSNLSFIIQSSLATVASAAGAVANLASNPINAINSQAMTGGLFTRGFTEQNWNSNKENLIYAICNQLNQFDQSDERFVEFCIKMLLNQPFSFQNMPDVLYLKSISSQISSRITYCYILISLLYSTRKNIQLSHNTLRFLTILLQCDIIKIDFLISKAGLIQVLFNLLRYFSDTHIPANTSKEIINDLKQLFCIVTRLLLRFNENQDVDNFSFYLNSIISLCYDSSNIGYEKLNLNLKSIVLNVFQSIMTDLNSIMAYQESNQNIPVRSSSILFKKILMPLIQTTTQQQQSSTNSSNLAPITSLFDSDFRFQKFIIFLVDFIHIIYDKISDSKIDDITYDLNDELSIFAFSILLNSLSIGLETQNKNKFTNFFRNNLTLVRFQFRRLFLFMMHPNHKLIHTKLQLIKRLLNASNTEIILRFIFSTNDEVTQMSTSLNVNTQSSQISFNLKLSFYLNALINSTSTTIMTSDKEILKNLNDLLNNIGFNYKLELDSILSLETNELASSYVLISNESNSNSPISKITSDYMNQCDKEFDEEILKIYYRTNQIFKRFLQQFDKLTEELNNFAVGLTNQVVAMHSLFRKTYLQRLKNKRIQIFDIKQKWLHLIEKMTHEKCLWHEDVISGVNRPVFFILDQTEGPNRERRRIKKVSHLNIESRFFKPEIRAMLNEEKNRANNQSNLKYLMHNYDYPVNTTNSGFSAGDYMLYYLKNSEVLKYPCACKNVMPYCEIKGELLLSEQRIYFAADEKEYANLMGFESNASYSWSYDDISEIHMRRYLLKDIGLELFLIYGHTILLAFDDSKERTSIFKFISGKIKNQTNKQQSLDELTNMWRESKMSNYEYLMQLNKYSGRTFNDLMQYPVYPHILSNYLTDTIDLASKDNYRDLTKPIAIQHKEREEKFLQNYRMLNESSEEAYHYASLYSNSGTVLHYLVRLPPFTKMFLDYQDNNFDVADRTFHSINTSFMLSSCESTTDYKELIPEFFFLHEFLTNRQGFNFGLRQNGEGIDNVTLPAWSKYNPRLFINIMRQALESNHVTCNINYWIDLVFGYKQSGKAALDAINCYHPACYFGYPVEQISDQVHRRAIETMIKTWGQTPKQLFLSSHPQSNLNAQLKKSNSFNQQINSLNDKHNFETNSIHKLIFNVRWGSYVGSLEQTQPPVCVWKEACKKNITSFVSLTTNDVIGLAQNKCLLVERNKDSKPGESSLMSLIEWGFYDDCIKARTDGDKQQVNLIHVRSSEHQVVCCQCIGSSYLVVGEKSGLVSVYKLKKDKKQFLFDSFYCHLYGHKQEITDIFVCLSFSTMVTASHEGILIIWDINKLSYVDSIQVNNQSIYKVSISETTSDIAFITNQMNNLNNKLYFYTGNCDLINQIDNSDTDGDNSIVMKSLCFSNCTEGQNVNVIAVGLSNGRIRLYSTWDLSLLRELSITHESISNVGCIISLTYTKDCKRLYASDTYARVYILESANTVASQAKQNLNTNQYQIQSSTSSQLHVTAISPNTSIPFFTNLACFT